MSRYSKPIREPSRGSLYAFLVRALEIIDADEDWPLSMPPIPITPDMTPADRRFAERKNPFAIEIRRVVRDKMRGRLRVAHMPEALLRDPVSPALDDLLGELVEQELRGMDACFAELQRSRPSPRRPSPQARAITGTWACTRPIAHAETAKRLMTDAAPIEGRLTRDSVSRGKARYLRDVLRMPNRLYMAAEASLTLSQVKALLHVFETAKIEQRLPSRVRGAELADAIHAEWDLPSVVARAYDRVGFVDLINGRLRVT